MKGKRKSIVKQLTFVEKVRRLHRAGIECSPAPNRTNTDDGEIDNLNLRIKRILGIVENYSGNSKEMIYFVMYDIENNKVRSLISKYLLKKGCMRVQKSIFLADTDRKVYDDIRKDLHEVQQCYDNNDSILLVPVSTDEIQAMKIIGQNIDVDLILKNRNTLFF